MRTARKGQCAPVHTLHFLGTLHSAHSRNPGAVSGRSRPKFGATKVFYSGRSDPGCPSMHSALPISPQSLVFVNLFLEDFLWSALRFGCAHERFGCIIFEVFNHIKTFALSWWSWCSDVAKKQSIFDPRALLFCACSGFEEKAISIFACLFRVRNFACIYIARINSGFLKA